MFHTRLMEHRQARYKSSPNQGLIRMPSTLPAKAATSHSQPCRLDEATPLKNAPMLHP